MENIDAETAEVFERALVEMKRRSAETIVFELSLSETVGLIGNLQLALRHPTNNGPTSVQTEKLVRDLIERLDPARGDFYQLLMLGFNENFDV